MTRKAESTDGEVDGVKAKSEVKATVDKEVKAENETKPKTTKRKLLLRKAILRS